MDGDRLLAQARGLTVTAYDCAPLANIPVTIKREYVPDSGGHPHLVSGNTTPPVADILDIAAPSGVTNASGIYTTEVKGMNIAGHLKITAESTGVVPGVTTKSQPFGLHVGFNNLVDLAPLDEPDLAGYLRLTGHNAATCAGTGCDNHRDLSHYAAPEMAGFLLDMAKEYNDTVGPAVIGVNDISLPDGGLFDIDGTWSPSHWYHRIGCGVDIDKTALNPETGADVVLDIYKLTLIVEALGGSKVPEGPVHYELPADVQDAVLGNAGWSHVVSGVTR
ncbi:MAG TPA: hypothetical protein VEO54_09515 [Thermoanaerobaculia bacterium]|nr:hypothetical protein [Thermoanaerobaculia bacterium]